MHRKAEEEVGAEPPADDDNAARRRLGPAQRAGAPRDPSEEARSGATKIPNTPEPVS